MGILKKSVQGIFYAITGSSLILATLLFIIIIILIIIINNVSKTNVPLTCPPGANYIDNNCVCNDGHILKDNSCVIELDNDIQAEYKGCYNDPHYNLFNSTGVSTFSECASLAARNGKGEFSIDSDNICWIPKDNSNTYNHYGINIEDNCISDSSDNIIKSFAPNSHAVYQLTNTGYINARKCSENENKMPVNGYCIQCPTGTTSNGLQCNCSDISQVFNPTSNTCNTCPLNSIYNASKKTCICNTSDNVYNPTSNTCNTCPINASYNDTINSCICDNNKVYNSSTNTCNSCPANSSYNDILKSCMCNSYKYKYDPTKNSCIFNYKN